MTYIGSKVSQHPNAQDLWENYSSYQEPGKSQWEKKSNTHQHWDDAGVRIIGPCL